MLRDLKYISQSRNLTEMETKKVKAFCDFLITNPKAKIIYRGENYENIKSKLNLTGNEDFLKLSYYTFLIGEKGRVYRKEYKEKIKNKQKLYSIDCIEAKLILHIFDKLNTIFITSKKPEVLNFISTNSVLADYFIDKKKNKSDFVKKVQSFNEKEVIKVRDYYLSLLHHIGQTGFHVNSFFVSTSTDFEIAKNFALNPSNSEGIVFVSWITYPLNRVGINFNYLNQLKTRIKDIDLPTYETSFFPKQQEITIKGGLLPQYILGYIRVSKNEFEINPHFIDSESDFENIMTGGIEIDQADFHSALKETDFTGFFTLSDDEEYSDFNL